jgi:hypothetical protein
VGWRPANRSLRSQTALRSMWWRVRLATLAVAEVFGSSSPLVGPPPVLDVAPAVTVPTHDGCVKRAYQRAPTITGAWCDPPDGSVTTPA